MKEHPILFSAPMVRAILEGRKTMTRRVVKVNPLGFGQDDKPVFGKCPYGVIGDRLWVRETWIPIYVDSLLGHVIDKTQYRADETSKRAGVGMWKPSIHMPRNRSRITLEITGVRVERLQEISEDDAKAEGVEKHTDGLSYKDYIQTFVCRCNARSSFFSLWTKINGRESWDANPWVWVVEFSRINAG